MKKLDNPIIIRNVFDYGDEFPCETFHRFCQVMQLPNPTKVELDQGTNDLVVYLINKGKITADDAYACRNKDFSYDDLGREMVVFPCPDETLKRLASKEMLSPYDTIDAFCEIHHLRYQLEHTDIDAQAVICFPYPQRSAYFAAMDAARELPNISVTTKTTYDTGISVYHLYLSPTKEEIVATPEEQTAELKKSLWATITTLLPKNSDTEPAVWTSGDLIIVASEETANGIADLLDSMGFDVVTGYYDPEADAASGETSELTGYWYVDIS